MKIKEKYAIGDVSEICNVPIKTLRYYDEIRLVVPKFRDEESKYRYYSKDQMVTIYIIRKLRLIGFALKEIQEIVNGNKADNLERSIEKKLTEINEEICCLQDKYAEGHVLLKRLKKGIDILSYRSKDLLQEGSDSLTNIFIEEIPETILFFSREIMKNYNNSEISLERWVEIIERCNKMKIKTRGTIIVTYHTNLLEQFLYNDCDIEFGIQIEEHRETEGIRKFGGFIAATAIHVGNYAEIINTHIKIIQWINKNGYKVAGEISEEFIISPLDVNNIDEHVTKIIVPVEKIT